MAGVADILADHYKPSHPTHGGEGVTKWPMAEILIPVPHFQLLVDVWVGVGRGLALG